MILEDTSPAISGVAPAPDIDQAIARVANLTANGLHGLIGCWFRDVIQFRQAMKESGWNTQSREVSNEKPDVAITLNIEVIGTDESKWILYANVWSNGPMQILNAKRSKKSDPIPLMKYKAADELSVERRETPTPTESTDEMLSRINRENDLAKEKTPTA